MLSMPPLLAAWLAVARSQSWRRRGRPLSTEEEASRFFATLALTWPWPTWCSGMAGLTRTGCVLPLLKHLAVHSIRHALSACAICPTVCAQFGAGIHALGYGTMAVHNCTFENHNAHMGSALFNQAGTIEMHNCIFRNNTAAAVGLQHASHLLHRVPTQ